MSAAGTPLNCNLPNIGETDLSLGVWLPKRPRFDEMRLFFLLLRMSTASCSPLLIWSLFLACMSLTLSTTSPSGRTNEDAIVIQWGGCSATCCCYARMVRGPNASRVSQPPLHVWNPSSEGTATIPGTCFTSSALGFEVDVPA